jgi:transcriptional regulator with XRE-family HTH domain
MGAEHFAGRLRELREGAGLTQEQLAERARVAPAAVRDLEQGRNQPRWGTVLLLAEALGVTDLREFAREPARRAAPRRGRPRKEHEPAAPAPAEQSAPKRGRGAKRSAAPGPVAGTLATEQQAVPPSGGRDADQLPPAQHKPKKRKARRPRG